MTKVKEMLTNGMIRAYVAYKNALTNRKGSPTVEYVILITAAAILAGFLLSGIKAANLTDTIKTKIIEAINKS